MIHQGACLCAKAKASMKHKTWLIRMLSSNQYFFQKLCLHGYGSHPSTMHHPNYECQHKISLAILLEVSRSLCYLRGACGRGDDVRVCRACDGVYAAHGGCLGGAAVPGGSTVLDYRGIRQKESAPTWSVLYSLHHRRMLRP